MDTRDDQIPQEGVGEYPTTPVLERLPVTVDIGTHSRSLRSDVSNQDRYHVSNSDHDDILMTYVFDGHGGAYVSDKLVGIARSIDPNINFFLGLSQLTDPNLDLKTAQELTDEIFAKIQHLFVGCGSVGSTAVIGVHQKSTGRVRFVHIGDSRAVWRTHQRRFQQIINHTDGETSDHKADRPDEIERVVGLGGKVIEIEGLHRVNGILAISRAFGDLDHRPYVCSTPDLSPLMILESGDYYILASDGVWDVISTSQALWRLTSVPMLGARGHAIDLVNWGLHSHDDTTAIVIKLL